MVEQVEPPLGVLLQHADPSDRLDRLHLANSLGEGAKTERANNFLIASASTTGCPFPAPAGPVSRADVVGDRVQHVGARFQQGGRVVAAGLGFGERPEQDGQHFDGH